MGGCKDRMSDKDRLLLSGDVEPNPGPPRRYRVRSILYLQNRNLRVKSIERRK